jgi:hypothetical protein
LTFTGENAMKVQIFKTVGRAEKAVLLEKVEYAIKERVFHYPYDIHYTYIYCTEERARNLAKKYSGWHLSLECPFTKNHPGFMMLSVEYTEAEKVLHAL